MDESLNWELLAKYLSDECSSHEKNEIETWINADPQNQQLLETLKFSWDTSEPDLQTSDSSRLWQQLAASTELDNGVLDEVNPPSKEPRLDRNRWPILSQLPQSQIWRYAAVLLIFILPFLYIFSGDLISLLKFGGQTEFITMSVGHSQRENITLSDGSVITLDAGTKFSYPEKFDGDKREVYLRGEAFFEVVSMPGMPFIVYANQAAIEVVGTRFNIRAWQQELKLTVTVTEGKVLLHPDKKESKTSVTLNPGYASTLPLNGPPTQPRLVDVGVSTGWLNNEVYFEDTPLSEILDQLERWYDVKFEAQDFSVTNDRLTVHFANESLEKHLKLISELADVRFTRAGKLYRLMPL